MLGSQAMSDSNRLTPMRRRAVDALLVRYLDLPEEKQDAFLDQVGERYPRLTGWLEQLCGKVHTVSLLGAPLARMARSLADSQASAPKAALKAGHRLGPWRILSEVGRGGMGRVYRAERADGAFDMTVAIKLIGQRRAGLVDLLQRECRLLARLDHPAVTRMLDAGLDAEAGPFLVMEWIDGADLDQWLADRHPALDRKLAMFEQCAEAVAHAHRKLIIHGDIKPANVRVREDGALKLMDFGVARLTDEAGSSVRLKAMTPAFAAPEQLDGEESSIATDIWSLGALLYWMLTGRLYRGDADSLQSHIADAGHARADELAALVAVACAEQPSARYQSVADLIEELRRFRGFQPLTAMPPSRRYRASRFIRRNPLLVGSATAIALVLCAGLATSTMMYLQAEQARQETAIERDRAETQAEQLEQIVAFQSDQVGELNVSAMALDLRERLEAAGSEANEESNDVDTIVIRPAALDFTGLTLSLLDEHLLEAGVRSIEAAFGDQPLVRARLLMSLARSRYELGLFSEAKPVFEQAASLINEHFAEDYELRSRILLDQSWLARDLGSLDEAEILARRAHELLIQFLDDDDERTLQALVVLGQVRFAQGKAGEAIEIQRDAYERTVARFGPESLQSLGVRHDLASALNAWGEWEESLELHSRNLELRRQMLDEAHPDLMSSLGSIAIPLYHLGRLEEAIEYTRQAQALRLQEYGRGHVSTMSGYNNLGYLLQMSGQPGKAESYYRRSLENSLRVLGENHQQTLYAKSNLGFLFGSQGDYERAVDYLEPVCARWQAIYSTRHASSLSACSNLAVMYRRAGQPHKALPLLTQTVADSRQAMTAAHLHLTERIGHLGMTLADLERHVEAEALLVARYQELAEHQAEDQQPMLAGWLKRIHESWHELAPDHGHDQVARHWADLAEP